jgi:tight adherence protein B
MWIVMVFGVIFAAIALLLLAVTAQNAARTKRVTARLESIRSALPSMRQALKPMDFRIAHTFSSIPWLNRLLQKVNLAPQLELLLRQAGMQWTVGRLAALSLLLGLGSGYLVDLRTHAAFLGACFAVAAGACPLLYVLRARRRRFDRIRMLLPDAIDLIVGALRAGHSLQSAMAIVSRESPEPLRGEFRQYYDEQNFGLELRTALSNLVRRVPLHEFRIISAAVLIQKETGGNLTEILERVSHLIREDFRLQRQIQVHSAQGRLTGYILATLPLGLGILMYLLNPEQTSLLWRHPLGLKMLYGSIISTTVGILIIRSIVRVRI